MIKPLLDYKLGEAELAAFGLIIIEAAHIEFFIESAISQLIGRNLIQCGRPEGQSMQWKIERLKEAGRKTADGRLAFLIIEFRWAMLTIRKLRNMLAHGILLYGQDGNVSLWSQWKLTELPLTDVSKNLPMVRYALHVAAHLNWHLSSIAPPNALPQRPF